MSAEKIRILFFGTPEFAAISLQALIEMPEVRVSLVVTQPDRPVGRGNKLSASAVKELAIKNNIPYYQPQSIKKLGARFFDDIAPFGPFDIGVVAAFGQILPGDVLSLPKAGSINVHASLLPRWRGAAPIQRAIMHGDSETGICLMKMEVGLDCGPVFVSASLPITESDNFGTLHDKLAKLGAELLRQHLLQIVRAELPALEQDENLVTYATKISNEESEIDWSRPAADLERQIRALCPFPGAFTWLNGKRLKIYSARAKSAIDAQVSGKRPGEIGFIDSRSIEVVCGKHVLSLLDLQLEGKKRLNASDFLRGAGFSAQTILGRAA